MSQLFTVVFMFGCLMVEAQNFEESMRALQDKYRNMSSMQIVMGVNVFETKQSNTPHYTMDIDIKKQGENYLYHFGNNEMLMNDKFLIVVDKNSKEIVYTLRNLKSEMSMRKTIQFDLDSILLLYKHSEYLGKMDQVQRYRVQEKGSSIRNTELFIRDDNGLLDRMCYEYSTGQFVSIEFRRFEINPVFPDRTFDEEKYMVISQKSNRIPSEEFKGYNITKAN